MGKPVTFFFIENGTDQPPLTYWGYGFFPGSVAYPSPFQLSTGQNEAAW
jgi:hypothetical protein